MNNFLCNNKKGNICFSTLYATDMYTYKKDEGYPLIIYWRRYKNRNIEDTQGCWQVIHSLTWKLTGCRQSVCSQKIHCTWHRKMDMLWTVSEIAECLMWMDKCPAVCSPQIIHCTWHTKTNVSWTVGEIAECLKCVDRSPVVCSLHLTCKDEPVVDRRWNNNA